MGGQLAHGALGACPRDPARTGCVRVRRPPHSPGEVAAKATSSLESAADGGPGRRKTSEQSTSDAWAPVPRGYSDGLLGRAQGLIALLALTAVATACATPPASPACVRFRRNLEGLAASGGPDANLQQQAFTDGLVCLQTDFETFRNLALHVARDPRRFRLADDYLGGWACQGEIALVIASIPHLGAQSYDLGDTDGQLDVEERTRLLRALRMDE